MQRTFISANSCPETFPPSSRCIQVSQSFGFAPNIFLLEAPSGSPGGRKRSSSCSWRPIRYRLLSKNDRRTMAVETTKSKKRVDKKVNLQSGLVLPASFQVLLAGVWTRDAQIERGRPRLAVPVARRRRVVVWGRGEGHLWVVVEADGRRHG